MEENKTPRYHLFYGAVIGLGLLILVNLVLLVLVLGRAWENGREYRELRAEFDRQRESWNTQAPSSYYVNYTNCQSLFCCRDVRLEVRNHSIQESPSCATNSYGTYYSYYGNGYNSVLSMNDIYVWLDDYIQSNRRDLKLSLSYDPETAAITEIRLNEWGQDYLILYENMTPIE